MTGWSPIRSIKYDNIHVSSSIPCSWISVEKISFRFFLSYWDLDENKIDVDINIYKSNYVKKLKIKSRYVVLNTEFDLCLAELPL